MKPVYEWSETELEMIKGLDVGLDHLLFHDVPPPKVYSIFCEAVFIKNLTGDHVEWLRRGMKALHSGLLYRLTPEWDQMLKGEIL